MDRPNVHDLFSRGSTPPIPPTQHQIYQPTHIESLFHGLNPAQDQQQSTTGSYASTEPPTPGMSQSDAAVSSSNVSTAESALLSLLGSVSSSGPSSAPPPPMPPTGQVQTNVSTQAQVLPALPGSSQRSGASPNNNESQGKILLEQLMSGCVFSHILPKSSRTASLAYSPPFSF